MLTINNSIAFYIPIIHIVAFNHSCNSHAIRIRNTLQNYILQVPILKLLCDHSYPISFNTLLRGRAIMHL